MERLTKKNGDGDYYYPKCLERCGGLETPEKCYECDFEYAVCKKLGEYEELENRLNKVYGGCDGLLSRVVEMLEKHPCIDIPNNTSKSRLLTDEDVDKWEEYKQLEEQGRLVKLPCKVGDIIYRVNAGAKEPVIKMRVLQVNYKQLHKDRIIIRIDAMNDNDMGESCYLLEDFGKNVFLTKSEAEAKLKELRGGENDG